MGCYETIHDYDWRFDWFSDLQLQNGLWWDYGWFIIKVWAIQILLSSKWIVIIFVCIQSEGLTDSMICNLKMGHYEIVAHTEWRVDRFSDLQPQNDLL